jgi:hypothetical protein
MVLQTNFHKTLQLHLKPYEKKLNIGSLHILIRNQHIQKKRVVLAKYILYF